MSTKQIKISLRKLGKALGKLLQSKWLTSYFTANWFCYVSELRGLGPTHLPRSLTLQPGRRLCWRGFHTTGVAFIFVVLWNALASDLRHSAFSSRLLNLALKKYAFYLNTWHCNIFR